MLATFQLNTLILIITLSYACHGFASPSLAAKKLAGRELLVFRATSDPSISRECRARDLIVSLVEDEECYSSEAGALQFGEFCALNVVYEDRFEPQPIVGRDVSCRFRPKP